MVGYPVTVAIPTYQPCAAVGRALWALARPPLTVDQYAVVVSVDGSEDGAREMVAEFPAP